jgi:hypothetical protein
MVACASFFNRGVRHPIGSSFGLLRGGRNSCLAQSSEQRRLVYGHRFHKVAACRGERARGFRSLIQVGERSRRSSTVDHVNERNGRVCKLVHGRGRTCRFYGVPYRSGREHRFRSLACRSKRARSFRNLIHVNERRSSFCKLVCIRDRACRFDGLLRNLAPKRSMRGRSFCSLPSEGMWSLLSLVVRSGRRRSFLCIVGRRDVAREELVNAVTLGKGLLVDELVGQPACARAEPGAPTLDRAHSVIATLDRAQLRHVEGQLGISVPELQTLGAGNANEKPQSVPGPPSQQ